MELVLPIVAILGFGIVLGAALMHIFRPPPPGPPPPPPADSGLAAIVSRAGHDLRGAIAPAVLIAETLESHADPAVRRAATIIAEALDRAATISRDTTTALKRHPPGT